MNKQDSLFPANVELVKLEENTDIKPFESEDHDLNDFLLNDAKNYLKSLFAVTYIYQTKDETVAFFCLSNDNLTKDEEEKSVWNKVNRAIPNAKRRKTYPAVKIGRLAVSKKHAGLGIGRLIIGTVINMYLVNQQAGCRFVTVDAYRNATPFYEKNGFKYLTNKDEKEDTRAMYLDLKSN